LDKTADGKEEVKKGTYLGMLSLPVDVTKAEVLQELLKVIDESHKNLMTLIAKRYNSPFRDKQTLNYIVVVANISHEIAKWGAITAYATDFNTKRLDMLDNALTVILNKLQVDLPNVTAELQSIRTAMDSPMITNVNNYIEQLKKNITEYKKKMEENDLAE
jgi:hypothetical protein